MTVKKLRTTLQNIDVIGCFLLVCLFFGLVDLKLNVVLLLFH